MKNDETWLDVLLVVQEDEFFTRFKYGDIGETVSFQIGESQVFRRRRGTCHNAGDVA